ncbi:hypothetical protein ACWCV9_33765 [Streptomyces sp. NPDC001606]
MSTRMSRRSRALATTIPLVTAALVGGLVTAAPATAVDVDTGSLNFAGTVTCAKATELKDKLKDPSKAVPTSVKLDSGMDEATDSTLAKDPKDQQQHRARYDIKNLEVPLDSAFTMTATVTCKAPKQSAVEFNREFPLNNLTEDQAQPIKLPIT